MKTSTIYRLGLRTMISVKLGDVGVLEGSVFKRTDTLETLGIHDLAVRRGQGTQVLEFSSRKEVEITWLVGGESAIKKLGGEVEINLQPGWSSVSSDRQAYSRSVREHRYSRKRNYSTI